MGYHPRIESKDYAGFLTSRSKFSELWFINNKALEEKILAHLAKYARRYKVILYAIAIEGSHIHILADFPECNCSDFKRDFNSIVAKLVPFYCPEYHGYKFWERRYSKELVPHHLEDIEDKFFYTVLQSVKDGLVERISDYPGYNCFSDAIRGIKREFKLVNWTAYNRANRGKKHINIKDYTDTYSLKFSRIPGYGHLSGKEYVKLLSERLEEKRSRLVRERREEGKGFVGRLNLLKTRPGTRAKNPKLSTRYSFRPRVHSVCPERRKEAKTFYFVMLDTFKKASARYRKGFLDTEFPQGMYQPHLTTQTTHPPPLTAAH